MAGLVRSKKLFTPKWVAGLQEMAYSGMAAEIKVYTVTTTYNGYVPVEVETAVFTGEARVQPVLSATQREVPGDDSKVQRVRFQILAENAGIELIPEVTKVKVTKCELNPSLKNFSYVVYEVMDSQNPFEITFNAEAVTNLVET